jgi:hypothetical protein
MPFRDVDKIMSVDAKVEGQEAPPYVVGWKEIKKWTPYSLATLQQQFAPDMLKNGFVFKSKFGRVPNRRVRVWSYPHLIIAYFSLKQQKQGFV